MFVRWYNGLHDRGRSTLSHKSYLSNNVRNLENKIIVAKEVPIDYVTDGKYMLYTCFNNPAELCRFIELEIAKKTERRFHESTPSNSRQKPRFDIDIKKTDHAEFLKAYQHANPNLVLFGEHVKDLVIRTSLEVVSWLGVEADVSSDIMLFTSHGTRKRSYHIILNRYYQHGVEQVRAFWNACLERCTNELDRAIFIRFVDQGPYSKNALLRMVWSTKTDGSERRMKKYINKYTYQGNEITHSLPGHDNKNISIARLTILLHGLVSFTEEAEALPKLAQEVISKYVESEDIDEATFQFCKLEIEKWDTERAFCVLEADMSIIKLSRLRDTYCPLCKRVHESDPFCYVNDRGLFWHCSRARGLGGVFISDLVEHRGHSNALRDRINACRLANSMEVLEGTEVIESKPIPKLSFCVLGEEVDIEVDSSSSEEEIVAQAVEQASCSTWLIHEQQPKQVVVAQPPSISNSPTVIRKPVVRPVSKPVVVVPVTTPSRVVPQSPISQLRHRPLTFDSPIHTETQQIRVIEIKNSIGTSRASRSKHAKLQWDY
ncbi:Hypothetical protein POVR2_LOCUS22 [uncultured virus]|nr:Hypothetical protein POVR2_LOCUS22 [uncultured virus]